MILRRKFKALIGRSSDAELVAACRGGDRAAFRGIVERYQGLLCSLAYSATGDVNESEDVAQEAFVAAWGQLDRLREPEKLRPWLCGILRNKVGRLRRRAAREPISEASSLEAAGEVVSGEQPATEAAIRKEEQAILWQALQRVPELYREPLVLFYREHRSVEGVARALDVSEDAVKQRLARGRKMLQEQVLAFVEGALSRSGPGRAFVLGVLASLPAVAAPSAKAAGVGFAAAQGAAAAKSAGFASLLASASGIATVLLTLRANLDQARTPRERRAVAKATLGASAIVFGLLGSLWLLREASYRWYESRAAFAVVAQALALTFVAAAPFAFSRMLRAFRELRSDERKRRPELFRNPRDQAGSAAGEYRSRATLLGLPLAHIRFSSPDAGAPPVVGWIAAGDRAYGILFAWGGLAVGGVSVGAVSVGVFAFGGLSIGAVGIGTVGVGFLAFGAVTVAAKAFAWLSALGWEVALSGGFAVAREAAVGPLAFARHANDAIAQQMAVHPQADQNPLYIFGAAAVMTLVPVAFYARAVRRRLGGG